MVNDGIRRIKDLGVYNPNDLVGTNYYQHIVIGNRRFLVMEPSIMDKISTIERRAQIVIPKDGMFIVFYCDLKSGDTVIEGGAGSGALTLLLANFVKPEGRIISYEIRDEFARIAKKNVKAAGLGKYVEFKSGDVTQLISEKNVDSVILDIPNPWDAVTNAKNALKVGGHIACYSPTMNQVEKTVNSMRNQGFIGVKTMETIQREIFVGEGGVRPSFDTLGHTGYVTFARKVS
jgi:tRNA (adenine57-N1/adenine58-N1)-methyltransferase